MTVSEVSIDTDYSFESYPTEITQESSPYAFENSQSQETLKGRVTLLNSNSEWALYKIDDCLFVRTPSEIFRKQALNHWNNAYSSASLKGWSWVILTGIAAPFTLTPFFFPAGIIALGGVFSAAYFFKQSAFAQTQIDQWSIDRAEWVAGQRKEALKKGFSYVCQMPLPIQFLLPFELKQLFDRYFDQFYTGLLNRYCFFEAQKKAWLKEFVKDNPLSEAALSRAYLDQLPQKYNRVSIQIEALRSALNQVENNFNALRKTKSNEIFSWVEKIKTEKHSLLSSLEESLRNQIREAANTRDQNIREAEKKRDDELRRIFFEYAHPPSSNNNPRNNNSSSNNQLNNNRIRDSKEQKARSLCEEEVAKYSREYREKVDAAQGASYAKKQKAEAHFQKKKEEVRSLQQEVMRAIDAQESAAIYTYYNYARALAQTTLALKTSNEDIPIPVFSPFNPPIPISITLDIHFRS